MFVVVVVNIFIFFCRTTAPISTKIGTMQTWEKAIKVYSKKGPVNPFPRGYNYEIVKIL